MYVLFLFSDEQGTKSGQPLHIGGDEPLQTGGSDQLLENQSNKPLKNGSDEPLENGSDLHSQTGNHQLLKKRVAPDSDAGVKSDQQSNQQNRTTKLTKKHEVGQ